MQRSISVDTIREVLVNDALRARLARSGDVEVGIDLVREALIEQNKKLKAEVEQAKADQARADALRKATESRRVAAEVEAQRLTSEAERRRLETEEAEKKASSEARASEHLKEERDNALFEAQQAKKAVVHVWRRLVLIAWAACLVVGGVMEWATWSKGTMWRILLAPLSAACSLEAAYQIVSRQQGKSKCWQYVVLGTSRRIMWGWSWVMFTWIVGSVLWEKNHVAILKWFGEATK